MKELQIIDNKDTLKREFLHNIYEIETGSLIVEHFLMNVICLCCEKIETDITSCIKKKAVPTYFYGDRPEF